MTKVFTVSLLLICKLSFAQVVGSSPVSQELTFREFKMKVHSGDSIVYYLGNITVPENRLSSNSGTVQLSILKLIAKSKTPDLPISFLAGGPGQSGINYIKQDFFRS